MSPKLLLSQWRERWDKAASAPSKTPYARGRLTELGDRLTQSQGWMLPGLPLLTSVVCIALFFLTLSVTLPTSGQVIFSVSFLALALYLRRYEGMLITLVLIGMSLIASTRYLGWRFNSAVGQGFDLDAILAIGLCLAELYLWILTGLGFVQAIYPLTRTQKPLATDSRNWPFIDVFILVEGHELKSVSDVATAVLALDWPESKQKIFILDDRRKAEIEALADSRGINYLVVPDMQGNPAARLNTAITETQGELIAVFQCGQSPDPQLLKMTAGGFFEDTQLGMLQTPDHFLAPPTSNRCSSIFSSCITVPPLALLRRSALLEAGGIDAKVTQESHIALKLQSQGYRQALLGFSVPQTQTMGSTDGEQENKTLPEKYIFLVDDPFSDSVLGWKKILLALQNFLKFYYVLPRLVFFTAPLIFLLTDIDLIQSTPTLFVAYFLPHMVHTHFVKGRLESGGRLTSINDLKEYFLAWYLLLPTTWSLLRIKISELFNIYGIKKKIQVRPFDWIITWSWSIIFALNLLGIYSGVEKLFFAGGLEDLKLILYLSWAFCNVLLLMSALAIAEESRHLQLHRRNQIRQSAMIRLPSGRTVTGVTDNFPDPELTIILPVKTTLGAGDAVALSLFLDNKEFTFFANVEANDNQKFVVTILDISLADYKILGEFAFGRDAKWPNWLPGRDADRLLPGWLSKPLTAILDKLLFGANKLGLPNVLRRLVGRIRKWEKIA